MTAEELIAELQKYPPHFEVKPYGWTRRGEDTYEIGKVNNFPWEKIVYIEILKGSKPI